MPESQRLDPPFPLLPLYQMLGIILNLYTMILLFYQSLHAAADSNERQAHDLCKLHQRVRVQAPPFESIFGENSHAHLKMG